jgi:hypothetical protein
MEVGIELPVHCVKYSTFAFLRDCLKFSSPLSLSFSIFPSLVSSLCGRYITLDLIVTHPIRLSHHHYFL